MHIIKRNQIYYASSKKKGKLRRVSLKTESAAEAYKMVEQYKVYCKDKGICTHKHLHHILTISDGMNHSAEAITISSALEEFINDKSFTLKPASIKTYIHAIGQFIESLPYDMLLREITNQHIKMYLRSNPSWSPAYRRNRKRHIKSFWNYLIDKEYVKNAFPKVDMPAMREKRSEVMIDTAGLDEIIEVFTAEWKNKRQHHQYRTFQEQKWFVPLMRLIHETGCRRSEALKLRYSDMDVKKQLIKIRAENAKTSRERYVPVREEMIVLLSDYVQATGRKHHEPIFKISADQAYRIFKRYARMAGYPDATIHGMRHNRITEWQEKGFSVIEAAQMAGHTNISVTMEYSHLVNEKLREKYRKLFES